MSDKEELLSKLGKHIAAKSCVYVKKMGDINIEVLKLVIKKLHNCYPKSVSGVNEINIVVNKKLRLVKLNFPIFELLIFQLKPRK